FLKFLVELKVEVPEPEAKAPVVVEPPKPKEGQVTVSCKPVDCEVLTNGTLRGKTKDGLLAFGPVPEGAVKVSVAADGYDPDRDAHNAVIRDGETTTVEFTLKPNR